MSDLLTDHERRHPLPLRGQVATEEGFLTLVKEFFFGIDFSVPIKRKFVFKFKAPRAALQKFKDETEDGDE